MDNLFVTAILFIFITITCYYDVRYKKIYNSLTVSFLLTGITVNICREGIHGVLTSAIGMAVGFVLLLFPYLYGWIGGGDVKFLIAAGCFVGEKVIFISTLIGLILFGIVALVYLIFKGRIKKFFTQTFIALVTWKSFKRLDTVEVSRSLPLGLFLGIGIILNWIYINFYI